MRAAPTAASTMPPLRWRNPPDPAQQAATGCPGEQPLGANAKIGLRSLAGSGTPTTGPGTCIPTASSRAGWETTVDQPGAAGILIALPGGELGAALGPHYGLTSYQGPAPARMARDFVGCFERNSPGASQAFILS
jgi:hypothetical protein